MEDAEKHIITIAAAVVPSENSDHCCWFLDQLLNGVRHFNNRDLMHLWTRSDLVVVSDRSAALALAVKTYLPQAHHRWCIVHLYRNLQKYRKSQSCMPFTMFVSTAREKVYNTFLQKMDFIKRHFPGKW